MGKNIYVEGSLIATTGDLYTHNVIVGRAFHPADSEVISPSNGVLKITRDTGSIFDTYYVREWMTAGGIWGLSKGAICAFADIYEFTIMDYLDGLRLIESMRWKQMRLTTVVTRIGHYGKCVRFIDNCVGFLEYNHLFVKKMLSLCFKNIENEYVSHIV